MSGAGPVLVRCDGSPGLGYGHVVRCLAIADELRDRFGVDVSFAVRESEQAADCIRQKGYTVFRPQKAEHIEQGAWLRECMEGTGGRILVADVRDDLTGSELARLRADNVLVALVDDMTNRRLAADLVFYPPVPQVDEADWGGFCGARHSGWEWVALRPEFSVVNRTSTDGRQLLVTMGGSDPAGLTLRCLRIIDAMTEELEVTVVTGREFAHRDALEHWLGSARRSYRLLRGVEDMAGLMAGMDFAVAAFGVTAYELAACGVPAAYLCLTPDHARSAEAFENAGLALSSPVYTSVTDEQLGSIFGRLVSDASLAARVRSEGPGHIDGRGAQRMAKAIIESSGDTVRAGNSP